MTDEMNMFGFDTNEVDTEIGIAAGDYPAVINTAKLTKTKDSSKMMFVLSYKIVGEKYNGKIFDYNNYVIDGPTGMGTKLFFKTIEDAGVEKSEVKTQGDLRKLIGKPLTIKVAKRKSKEGVEEQYASVVGTSKREVAESEQSAEF